MTSPELREVLTQFDKTSFQTAVSLAATAPKDSAILFTRVCAVWNRVERFAKSRIEGLEPTATAALATFASKMDEFCELVSQPNAAPGPVTPQTFITDTLCPVWNTTKAVVISLEAQFDADLGPIVKIIVNGLIGTLDDLCPAPAA